MPQLVFLAFGPGVAAQGKEGFVQGFPGVPGAGNPPFDTNGSRFVNKSSH